MLEVRGFGPPTYQCPLDLPFERFRRRLQRTDRPKPPPLVVTVRAIVALCFHVSDSSVGLDSRSCKGQDGKRSDALGTVDENPLDIGRGGRASMKSGCCGAPDGDRRDGD